MRTRLVFATALLLGTATVGCFDALSDGQVFRQGTGGSSGAGGTGGTGGGTTTPLPGCIPKDETGPVEDKCGVFVSASKGDDAMGTGTKDAPVATLAKALELATADSLPVYMCAETFAGAVQLGGSALIYGGLDCADGWKYAGDAARTEFTADADQIPLRLTGDVSLEMFNVKVTAADALAAGGSSIAVLAKDKSALTLTRCDIAAGTAANGAEGAPFPDSALDGIAGINGGQACSAGTVVTAAPPKSACADVDSVGGSGGIGMSGSGSPGSAGEPFDLANAGDGDSSGQCAPGQVGSPGGTGAPGLSAPAGFGSLDGSEGFKGVSGGDGMAGRPGQGGGGGGGSRGGNAAGQCLDAALSGGASGGTGGSGGCGGLGGKGGGSGGASIAVVSLGATLIFHGNVTLVAKSGGLGGGGGAGQDGGIGGGGSLGGTKPLSAANLKGGCAGAPGGHGGSGGTGGGGQGGHSIGIAYTGDAPDTTGVAIELGAAGDGGPGGDVAGKGAQGVAAETHAF